VANSRVTATGDAAGNVPSSIDTIGLSVPIISADEIGATVSIVRSGTPDETRTFRRKLDGGGFLAWGMGQSAWIEASLPKRVSGGNVAGLPVAEALEAVADLYDEAAGFLEVRRDGVPSAPLRSGSSDVRYRAGSWIEAKVVRLDLVRDFDDVHQAPFLLDGLANVPMSGRAKVRRYADAERNRAETLTVGPMAAWKATLYDKHAETAGTDHEAPEGRLRFETRMRSDLLTSVWASKHGGHIAQVMDLDEHRVRRLTRSMFERVGFDREVDAMGRLVQLVFGADGLTASDKRGLWCFLTAGLAGADLGYHRNTERKYRALAADLGIVAGPLTHASAATVVALDYDSGREVTRRAA
jgi:hypothetical protein